MLEQWEFNKLLPISQSAGKCFKNARLKRPSLSAAALPSLSVCRPSWNSKLYKKKNWFCGFYVNCCHMSTASSSSVRLNSICAAHTYIYVYLCMYIFRIYLLSCCFYFPHSLRSVSPKTPHSTSIHRIPSAGSPHYYYYYYLFFFCFFRSVYGHSPAYSCFSDALFVFRLGRGRWHAQLKLTCLYRDLKDTKNHFSLPQLPPFFRRFSPI